MAVSPASGLDLLDDAVDGESGRTGSIGTSFTGLRNSFTGPRKSSFTAPRSSGSNRSQFDNIVGKARVSISTSARYNSDDEEALKWAALERLPTFDRLRTTIVEKARGSKVFREELDLRTLDQERLRHELISKLFDNNDDEDSTFIFKLRERIDKAGVTLPTVEVRYENLNIEAKARVGGRSLPNLINAAINAVESCFGAVGINVGRQDKITILHNVSGVIKPSRMTLLLGPPSSGKTTLLLALAGKLDSTLKVSGKITYNGYGLDEFVPQKSAAYVSQQDLHVGVMTVRETFEYSAKSQDVGPRRYELLTELIKREKELGIHPDANVDYYLKAATMKETSSSVLSAYMLKILDLDLCSDTLVGDEMVRGISGGQKKRLTTGEILVGPMKTLFMDEISSGLDSSTTFQIVKYLRDITHKLESTMLISLLQPAPETYDLFDDIILLSEGQIVYHGPREQILDFFQSCGFKCPERKGVADFLQEVTSRKDQEQYWADKSRPYEYVPVRVFSKSFESYRDGVKMADELKTPFDKLKGHEGALTFKKYQLSAFELVKISFDKEWLLIKRNAFIYISKAMQISITAVIAVNIFIRTRMPRNNFEDAQVFAGALFFGVSNLMFNGYAELSLTILRLPVFYKQRDMLFFPAWAWSLAILILSIPVSIVETFVWVTITYYSIGFAPAASRYFRQLLLYFLMHQMSGSLFRLIAGTCRSMVLSNTGGTFGLLGIFVLGGFFIRPQEIRGWWIWGYWSSPLTYAQGGASVLEFLSPQWNKPYGNSTESLGVQFLKNAGISTRGYWYWVAVVALFGYIFLFNLLFTLAITFLGPLGKRQAVLSEEQRAEAHANLTGEVIVPSDARLLSRKRSVPRSLSSASGAEAVNAVRKSGLNSRRTSNISGREENDVQLAKLSGGGPDGDREPSTTRSSITRNSIDSEDVHGVAAKRGMTSLPFQPLSISFDDVNYYVDMPAQMKAQGAGEDRLQLLQGITGAFRPGVLTALVGVSGAGKTTLMDVLAGRKTGGEITGDIRISGFPKNQETFARISGYCEQTDVHSPQVTVHESLIYSAWLRLHQDIDNQTKAEFVEEVMDLVELTSLKDALVGLPFVSGLSTEQRKRLTIAVELVANPSIVFMDEPTSGLDARAAAIVMRTVRNTVDTGRTVVCTIHQPSIDIFDTFDELLLMKRGGQLIYAGPLGKHAHKLVEFFAAVPGVPNIKEGYNPATWMLEVTSVAVEQHLNVDFAEIYEKSKLFERNKALVQQLSKPLREDAEDLWFPTQYAQPFWSQVSSCLWKQHLTYWRSPDYNTARLLFATLAALFFGTVYWQKGKSRASQSDIASIGSAMVAGVIFVGINNASTVQPVVATERTVFYRERAAGMYAAAPYAMAQVLIELPYCLLLTTVYSLITYSMMGLEWTPAKFFWYFYFLFFAFTYFTYYGMMAVGLTPNHQIAAVVAAFFYQIWNVFSGYLIPKKRLPKWVVWYYWICPVSWTMYGLVVSQFGDVNTLLIPVGGTSNTAQKTISQFIEDFFGFKHSFLPVVAVMHLVFSALFAFIFMLTIKYLNFQTR